MNPDFEEALAAARKAYADYAWDAVLESYDRAASLGDLPSADLSKAAWVSWLAGRVKPVAGQLARAFTQAKREGNPAYAAGIALELVRFYAAQTDGWRQASGWLKRAQRLLDEAEESPAHGKLEWVLSRLSQTQGNLDKAGEHADRALALGIRFGDADLEALALNRKGRVLIKQGKLAEGNALLDEAMIGIAADELDVVTAGIVYCSTIDSCADVYDWGRAGEWTRATEAWCESKGVAGYPGICRLHRAELMRLHGDLPMAASEAERATRELQEMSATRVAGAGHYELGLIRLRQGQLVEADAAFQLAEKAGRTVEPGRSQVLFAEGKVDAALARIRRAIDETGDPLSRTRLLPVGIEIAVVAGAHDTARQWQKELSGAAATWGTPALEAEAKLAGARVQLASGASGDATLCLRAAVREYRQLDLPYDAARARVLLAQAYRTEGDAHGAESELGAALQTFERLGAAHDTNATRALLGALSGVVETDRFTFVFTDIVDSTPLAEALGNEAWTHLLRKHDETLRECFRQHGGSEVKHTGDGFLVTFHAPTAAVACAVEIQRTLAVLRRSSGFAPEVRIGMHQAEATRHGSDYAGKGVHAAARISGLAGGGQIFGSWSTLSAAAADAPCAGPREVQLKGIAEAVAIGEVLWSA
jgi:class 3 adenylate cyclase